MRGPLAKLTEGRRHPYRVMAAHPTVGLDRHGALVGRTRRIRDEHGEPRTTGGRHVPGLRGRYRVVPRDRRGRGGGGDGGRRGRGARPLPPRGRGRADARRARRAAGARSGPRQRVHRVLRRPRPRHAVLLRRLRDRPAASAGCRCAWGCWAGRCRWRSPTPSAACSPWPAWWSRSSTSVRPRDDGDRDPVAGALRHRRAAQALRHVPARGGRGGGVRPDPAAHARPLDAERAAQRADPRRVRPGRRRGRRRGGPLVRAHARAVRAHARVELAAGGPLDRRARLRAGAARQQARARPAARRVRRRPDHPAGAPEVGDARCSTRSSTRWRSGSSCRSSSW